jgi:hypothetical protein
MNKMNTVWNHCRPEDFVPTTHDVRSNYVGLEGEFSFPDAHVDSDACVAEFNRWLAEVIREARFEGWQRGNKAHPKFGVNPYGKEQ